MSHKEDLDQSWMVQLQIWSADARLFAAGVDALRLKPGQATKQLSRVAKRLAKCGARDLPPIEVLTASAMSGAAGAYAESTGRVYINELWLRTAKKREILFVLTAEFGHQLNAQRNTNDTWGDEANTLKSSLFRNPEKQRFNSKSGDQKHGPSFANKRWITAEFESWTANSGGDSYPNADDGDDNSDDESLIGSGGRDTIDVRAGDETITGNNGEYSTDGGCSDNRTTLQPWGNGTKFADATAHPYSYAIDTKDGAVTILGHLDLDYLKTATSDGTFDYSTSWSSFSTDGERVPAYLVIGAKNDGGGDMTLSFQLSDLEMIDTPEGVPYSPVTSSARNKLLTQAGLCPR